MEDLLASRRYSPADDDDVWIEQSDRVGDSQAEIPGRFRYRAHAAFDGQAGRHRFEAVFTAPRVTDLRRAISAIVKLAIDHQPAADAGADGNVKHALQSPTRADG